MLPLIPIPPDVSLNDYDVFTQEELVDKWVEFFKQVTSATSCYPFTDKQVILLSVRACPENEVSEVIQLIKLKYSGSFELDVVVGGKLDLIFEKWLNDLITSGINTWIDLHSWIKRLYKEYYNC